MLAIELEDVEAPVVLTASDVVEARAVALGSRAASCLASRPEAIAPRAPVVTRMGVRSESITFRDTAGRSLVACDGVPGDEPEGSWCGSAHGMLIDGRLSDPRLDLGCTARDGIGIGLLWIEPAPETAYVAVEQDGYVEVYATGGGLPVRIATEDVEVEGSRAFAAVSEHDAAGDVVRRYELDAAVAG